MQLKINTIITPRKVGRLLSKYQMDIQQHMTDGYKKKGGDWGLNIHEFLLNENNLLWYLYYYGHCDNKQILKIFASFHIISQ